MSRDTNYSDSSISSQSARQIPIQYQKKGPDHQLSYYYFPVIITFDSLNNLRILIVSLRKLRHNQSISYTCANPHRMSASNLTSTSYFLTYLRQNEGAEPGKYKRVEIRVSGIPRRSISHTRNSVGFVLGLRFS